MDAVDPDGRDESIGVNRERSSDELIADQAVALVFDTFDAIGLTDKEAARFMAIDTGQLGRIKARRAGARMPFDALWRMPQRFWVEFHRRIAIVKGIEPESREDAFAQDIGRLVQALLTHKQARRRTDLQVPA